MTIAGINCEGSVLNDDYDERGIKKELTFKEFMKRHGRPIDEIEMAYWHNWWGKEINDKIEMFMERAFKAGKEQSY